MSRRRTAHAPVLAMLRMPAERAALGPEVLAEIGPALQGDQPAAERRLALRITPSGELLTILCKALGDENPESASAAARILGMAGERAAAAKPALIAAVDRYIVGEDAIDALRQVARNDDLAARTLSRAWWRLDPAGTDDARRMRIFEAIVDFMRHRALFETVLRDALSRKGWWEAPHPGAARTVRTQAQEVRLVAFHVGLTVPGAEVRTIPDGWRPRGPRDRWPRHARQWSAAGEPGGPARKG